MNMSEKQKISENLRRLAKQHAINNFSFGNGEFYESAAEPSFISGFLAAQKWIPVEIDMPNEENGYVDKIVLIKSKNGQVIETAKYSSTQNRWLYSSIASRNPSYWRPIDFL